MSVGYRELLRCSHLLKEKIVQELEIIAGSTNETRSSAACWELCICYFDGFGVIKDVPSSCAWLAEAAKRGVLGARAYYYRLHRAMGVDPHATLQTISNNPDVDLILDWVLEAVSFGYLDVLPDLELLDKHKYKQARELVSQKFGESTKIYDEDQTVLLECTEFSPGTPEELALAIEITQAAVKGQVAKLNSLLDETPRAINFQDENGDTALICAA